MKSITPVVLVAALLFSCQPNKNKVENIQPSADKAAAAEIVAVNNGDVPFDNYFLDKTMRLDFFHTGNAMEEMFAVDKVLSDGPWSGSRKILIDKTELGPYFFEVIDRDTRVLLYSRGFANIFGEWQSTPEAEAGWGTFHESLRFPWPGKPVTVIVKKRDAENKFSRIWTTNIDPSYRQVNPCRQD
jgi:hypothetical protein